MKLRKEKSCGCIITKDGKYLLVCSKDKELWGFPKGHMENGETEIQTALREVKEEVGLDVEINPTERYTLNYNVRNEIDKTVILFLAKPKSDKIVLQESEISNSKWCDYEEAIDTLSFDNRKEVLKKLKNK